MAPQPTNIGREPSPEVAASEVNEVEWTNRKATALARRAAEARHQSGRRTMVDPATCDRSYNSEELEFMQAMQDYKQSSGRMFPTWSEVLEVIVALGYKKSSMGVAGKLGTPPPKDADER